MKRLILQTLLVLSLGLPTAARPGGSDSILRQQTQDRWLHYGSLLHQLNQRYQLVDRLTDLATPEQVEALHRLRISPSQAVKLTRLMRDHLPDGRLDDQGWKELRRKITPQAEDILGSEQFDRLLELVPSPQQEQRMETIFQQAAATPEGREVEAAAEQLGPSLTSDQKAFLEPALDLMKRPDPVNSLLPTPRPALESPSGTLRRRLVQLRRTSVGEVYAEIQPETNFTEYLPRRLRLSGGDPAVLANLSGLPVRLEGQLEGDCLKIAPLRFTGDPPVLPVPGGAQVWRGCLPAQLLSSQPPLVELDTGRGQTLRARLEIGTAQEKENFNHYAAAGKFLLGATAITRGSETVLVDLDFAPFQEPRQDYAAGLLLQVSEEFLGRACNQYLDEHWNLGGRSDSLNLQLSRLGITLQGCQPGQARLFGQLKVEHSGLMVMELSLELLVEANPGQGKLRLKPVPKSLQAALSYPLWAPVPSQWMENLEEVLGEEYASGMELTVTGQQRDRLLESGLLEGQQLDNMRFFTRPAGDRRTSLVSLATPALNTPPAPVLRSRIQAPGEWTLALSQESINQAIQRKLPGLLPILRPVPAELSKQAGAVLTKIEVPELELSFADGLFRIHNCVVNFHWSYAFFSGVEPGFRLRGALRLLAEGNPLQLKAQLQIESLEFLSRRVLDQSPQDQESQKQELLKTLQEHPLELGELSPWKADLLSPRAELAPTAVDAGSTPSELRLHGRLQP